MANEGVMRWTVRDVPRQVHTALKRALLDAEAAGVDVSVREATIRGLELATEELRKSKPEALRRIYKR